MSEFKREVRYVSLKLKHMTQKEKDFLYQIILDPAGAYGYARFQTEGVCVEKHWPVYEQTWDAVKRMSQGKPQRIKELEQQNAELMASNENLKRAISKLLNDENTYRLTETGAWSILDKAYYESPRTSLAEHSKAVIEELKQEVLRSMDKWENLTVVAAERFIDDYANTLNQDKESK